MTASAYTTLAAVKAALRITDTVDDQLITSVITSASARIDNACNRVFTQSTGDRYYYPRNVLTVPIDDLATTAGLVVRTDTNGDGSWATTLTSSQYQLEPLNALAQGRPVRMIRALGTDFGGAAWPISPYGRAMLKITGTWGWPAVPAEIEEATRLLTIRQFKRFDSPLGVAGFGDLGAMMVRNIDPDIQALIAPFMLVAVA